MSKNYNFAKLTQLIESPEFGDQYEGTRILVNEVDVDTLLANYQHPNNFIRCMIAQTLGKIGEQRATPILLELLNDPHHGVCSHVAGALGDLKDKRAVEPLMNKLISPNQWSDEQAANVRIFIVDALGKIGDQRALPILEETAKNDTGRSSRGARVNEHAQEAIDLIKEEA